MIDTTPLYDVLIVGGGPAGLSAALVLGRACRRVIVFDAGTPRNAASRAMHGYLSRDGVNPHELLRLGRDEVCRYGVQVHPARVKQACRREPPAGDLPRAHFEVTLETGQTCRGRRLLLATGVTDELPAVPGAREYYGRGVHHCPYCDAWEYRGKPLAAYGRGQPGVGLGLALRTWSPHVTVVTDGRRLSAEQRRRLARLGIAWRTEKVTGLEGTPGVDGILQQVAFADSAPLPCAALFFNTGQVQQSQLPAMLGCGYDERGHVRTRPRQRTRIPGLYLAGDADGDVQFVIVAAAEGATAAVAINKELQEEDRGESHVRAPNASLRLP